MEKGEKTPPSVASGPGTASRCSSADQAGSPAAQSPATDGAGPCSSCRKRAPPLQRLGGQMSNRSRTSDLSDTEVPASRKHWPCALEKNASERRGCSRHRDIRACCCGRTGRESTLNPEPKHHKRTSGAGCGLDSKLPIHMHRIVCVSHFLQSGIPAEIG